MKFISIGSNGLDEYGNSFDEVIENKNINYFIKFYHPKCIHCINMKDAWNSLKSNKFLKNNKIKIIEVHVDSIPTIKNTIKYKIKGYPTILGIDNINNSIIKYNGNRMTDDMVSFILKNLTKNRLKKLNKSKRNNSRRLKKSRRNLKKSGKNISRSLKKSRRNLKKSRRR